MPVKYSAIEWYEIKDRGKVAICAALPKDEYDPDNLKGEVVNIDSKEYKVMGVESFAIPRSIELPYKLSFGLLVEPVPTKPKTKK
jgi:hypothetical protein